MSETTTLEPAISELSDDDVVRRVAEGEVGLFEVLMRRHNQRVYRVARSVLADDALAEHLAQEAWVRERCDRMVSSVMARIAIRVPA
jgi:RNA polymerase sigma-70 factor (ECF subfamily)